MYQRRSFFLQVSDGKSHKGFPSGGRSDGANDRERPNLGSTRFQGFFRTVYHGSL